MSEHTPGPWKAVAPIRPTRPFVIDAMQKIGVVDGPVPFEEREANARLIAAAPDLLAALEKLSDTISDYPLGRASGSDVADAIGEARVAIAKAEETS